MLHVTGNFTENVKISPCIYKYTWHLNIMSFTFVVAAVEIDNTERGKRPGDRVVIEFHVIICWESGITRFFSQSSSSSLRPSEEWPGFKSHLSTLITNDMQHISTITCCLCPTRLLFLAWEKSFVLYDVVIHLMGIFFQPQEVIICFLLPFSHMKLHANTGTHTYS